MSVSQSVCPATKRAIVGILESNSLDTDSAQVFLSECSTKLKSTSIWVNGIVGKKRKYDSVLFINT